MKTGENGPLPEHIDHVRTEAPTAKGFGVVFPYGATEEERAAILRQETAPKVASSCGLTDDRQERKDTPVATGCIDYFPDALAAVAGVSFVGSQQHNPGKPLHWDRDKSGDEADCLMRHFLQRGTIDTDGCRHTAKVAWRALALLQKEIEADRRRLA